MGRCNKIDNIIKAVKKYKAKVFIFYMVEIFGLIKLGCLIRLYVLKAITYSKLGNKIIIERNFYITPFCKIKIGDNVRIGRNSYFESKLKNEKSKGIDIKNNVWISHDFHLQCSDSISIGNDVLIGEFVSIRGNTHSYSRLDMPIKKQEMIIGSITIEDGVWIGRGCLLLGRQDGIVIGENSIIAANSMITESIPPNTIWGGCPAKFIKNRK